MLMIILQVLGKDILHGLHLDDSLAVLVRQQHIRALEVPVPHVLMVQVHHRVQHLRCKAHGFRVLYLGFTV